MINEIVNDAKGRMQKSVDVLKTDLTKLRTGRANPSLLAHLMVPYYGTDTPLSQIANVSVENARTLMVTPWEKDMVAAVEKAIMTSDLGLNPSTAGTLIRVPLPALTEDRRRELVKLVHGEGERARVAIRNIRRDANNDFKELLKDKEITEDDERKAVARIQKVTDDCVGDVDTVMQEKEKDLMEI